MVVKCWSGCVTIAYGDAMGMGLSVVLMGYLIGSIGWLSTLEHRYIGFVIYSDYTLTLSPTMLLY